MNKDGDIDNDNIQKIVDKCVSQIFVFYFDNDTWEQVLQYCGSFIYHTLILNLFYMMMVNNFFLLFNARKY